MGYVCVGGGGGLLQQFCIVHTNIIHMIDMFLLPLCFSNNSISCVFEDGLRLIGPLVTQHGSS